MALLLYLWLTNADPLPFLLFLAAYAAGGKEKVQWQAAALVLVFICHVCLGYRWLGERAWSRPPWVCRVQNHTVDPTPLSTIEGYASTMLLYTSLALMSFAMLPVTIYGRWLFWLSFTSALSFWYTVPFYFASSPEMKGASSIILILSAAPLIGLAVWASPEKLADVVYSFIVVVILAAFLANGFHIHHSAWPWVVLPLFRHEYNDQSASWRVDLPPVGAGVLLGMATQEISGSGFAMHPEDGW